MSTVRWIVGCGGVCYQSLGRLATRDIQQPAMNLFIDPDVVTKDNMSRQWTGAYFDTGIEKTQSDKATLAMMNSRVRTGAALCSAFNPDEVMRRTIAAFGSVSSTTMVKFLEIFAWPDNNACRRLVEETAIKLVKEGQRRGWRIIVIGATGGCDSEHAQAYPFVLDSTSDLQLLWSPRFPTAAEEEAIEKARPTESCGRAAPAQTPEANQWASVLTWTAFRYATYWDSSEVAKAYYWNGENDGMVVTSHENGCGVVSTEDMFAEGGERNG